jgi:hypothetical protein
MRRWQNAVFAVMIVATVGGAAPLAASGALPAPCATQRLRIVELVTIPELVQAGKQIQLWKVTIRSSEECLTVLEVRERDRTVGRSVPYLIKSGEFSYTVTADPNYRFQVQEHCFKVLVNVADTWAPVDPVEPQKLFCARYRAQPPPGSWSLK